MEWLVFILKMVKFVILVEEIVKEFFCYRDVIKFGNEELEVRSTPGHTKSCLSFITLSAVSECYIMLLSLNFRMKINTIYLNVQHFFHLNFF